jgi:hypothetical protein
MACMQELIPSAALHAGMGPVQNFKPNVILRADGQRGVTPLMLAIDTDPAAPRFDCPSSAFGGRFGRVSGATSIPEKLARGLF